MRAVASRPTALDARAEYHRLMNATPDPVEEQEPGAGASTARSGRSLGGVLRIVGVFLAVGLLVVLTLQNTAAVTLNVLVWSVTLSLALFVFIVIVVGVVIGWVLRSARDDGGFRPLG